MNNLSFNKKFRFYGRRVGRKLSKANSLALKQGEKDYLIKLKDMKKEQPKIFPLDLFQPKSKKIIIEIGFGSGTNLINSAIKNSEVFYIGADPFLNTTARLIRDLFNNKITNIKIWPDDIREILPFFPNNSVAEVKILFPDPWPKTKHKNRRLIQDNFIDDLYNILIPNGTITLATDHSTLKSWILEVFQRHKGYFWTANHKLDWQKRPLDCFATKYEQKSIEAKREPSWFIFQKMICN